MNKLIKELQRRNVFRVGLAYLALAWLVIQITDVAVPALNLPDVLHGIVFYIGLVGFPFALFFAWAFELTPEGLKRSEDVPEQDSIRPATGRSLERIALVFALGALAFVIWDAYLEPQPVEVPVASAPPVVDTAPVVTVPAEVAAPQSIAVLPFVNMSDDKDYFADGLSEELLNLLAKIPGLQVTGRTSSFAFKGRNVDLREIGASLGVDTILEGSVRRSGDQLRITAQLVKVTDGFHLWSETYDRKMTDIFAIQDSIAASIIDALKLKLLDTEPDPRLPTDNMEAYELYLKARPLLVGFDTVFEAEKMLLKAVELDPGFAYAWSGLAQALNNLGAYGLVPWEDVRERRQGYARRAFELDPSLLLDGYTANWRPGNNSVAQLQEIIRRAPNTIYAYDWLGNHYVSMGYFQRALDVYDAGLAIDPFFPDLLPQRSMALEALGRTTEAEQTLLRWSDIVGLAHPRLWLALKYISQGNENRTEELLAEHLERHPQDGELEGLQRFLEAILDPDTRQQAIQDPRFDRYMRIPGNQDFWIPSLYALLDDRTVWSYLTQEERSMGINWQTMQFILSFYRDHTLMEDPEFRQVTEAMGLVDIWRQHGPPDFCGTGLQSWVCDLGAQN